MAGADTAARPAFRKDGGGGSVRPLRRKAQHRGALGLHGCQLKAATYGPSCTTGVLTVGRMERCLICVQILTGRRKTRLPGGQSSVKAQVQRLYSNPIRPGHAQGCTAGVQQQPGSWALMSHLPGLLLAAKCLSQAQPPAGYCCFL